jgi:hypothetical protein
MLLPGQAAWASRVAVAGDAATIRSLDSLRVLTTSAKAMPPPPDINPPDGPGTALLRGLRAPVFMLTALFSVDDRVGALDPGV